MRWTKLPDNQLFGLHQEIFEIATETSRHDPFLCWIDERFGGGFCQEPRQAGRQPDRNVCSESQRDSRRSARGTVKGRRKMRLLEPIANMIEERGHQRGGRFLGHDGTVCVIGAAYHGALP